MKSNQQIAKLFDQVADLLEFQGESSFRFRGYRNAADVLRGLDVEVAELLADPTATLPPKLGKTMSERCREIVATGRLPALDEITRTVPITVLDIMQIPKLGPKKAAQLYRELNIATIDQLREACRNQQVQKLSGFAAKTEQSILAGINHLANNPQRWLWADADHAVTTWSAALSNCAALQKFAFVGDYRRLVELLDGLVLLVDCSNRDELLVWLNEQFPQGILQLGGTAIGLGAAPKIEVTRNDLEQSPWVIEQDGLPSLEIQFAEKDTWGFAELIATGGAAHWQQLQALLPGESPVRHWPPINSINQDSSMASLRTTSETEIYADLQMDWIPPELRDGQDEIALAQSRRLPKLIELADIRGDMHSHTTATDGSASFEQMALAAHSRGLQFLAVTDHSQRVAMARGLDSDRLLAQWRQLDRWNEQNPGEFRLLRGIECDILENGAMDLPDDVLAEADWVIASVHYGQQQPREQITDRILRALANPHVDIIAHPTGRLLNRRPPYQVDMVAVMQAAVEYKKCLELNASPKRLDLNVEHLRLAKSLGIPIVISTDAHSPRGLDAMRFGINQARRAGLTASDVLNCRPWSDWPR